MKPIFVITILVMPCAAAFGGKAEIQSATTAAKEGVQQVVVDYSFTKERPGAATILRSISVNWNLDNGVLTKCISDLADPGQSITITQTPSLIEVTKPEFGSVLSLDKSAEFIAAYNHWYRDADTHVFRRRFGLVPDVLFGMTWDPQPDGSYRISGPHGYVALKFHDEFRVSELAAYNEADELVHREEWSNWQTKSGIEVPMRFVKTWEGRVQEENITTITVINH